MPHEICTAIAIPIAESVPMPELTPDETLLDELIFIVLSFVQT